MPFILKDKAKIDLKSIDASKLISGLKQACAEGDLEVAHRMDKGVLRNPLHEAKSVEDALEAVGFSVCLEQEGDCPLERQNPVTHSAADLAVFRALAPFVKSGSHWEVQTEIECYRVEFQSGDAKLVELEPR